MKVVILGCGGHARSVADVLLDLHADAEVVFVDENAAEGERILGCAEPPEAFATSEDPGPSCNGSKELVAFPSFMT